MTPAAFRKLALSMPDAHEEPHFERASFRAGKKIFATMTRDGSEAMVPVHPVEDCLALIELEPEVFFGYGGWTQRNGSLGVRLAKADAKRIGVLIREAFERIAPKGPGAKRAASKALTAKGREGNASSKKRRPRDTP